MTDYEGTLARVAAIGYTEIEPTGYNNMAPSVFRAMLDRYKLTMPSTHAAARREGAEPDKQLDYIAGVDLGGPVRRCEPVALRPAASKATAR